VAGRRGGIEGQIDFPVQRTVFVVDQETRSVSAMRSLGLRASLGRSKTKVVEYDSPGRRAWPSEADVIRQFRCHLGPRKIGTSVVVDEFNDARIGC
jgi:hypothetical protein